MTKQDIVVTSLQEAIEHVEKELDLHVEFPCGVKIRMYHDAAGYWSYDDDYGLETVFANNNEEAIARLKEEFERTGTDNSRDRFLNYQVPEYMR